MTFGYPKNIDIIIINYIIYIILMEIHVGCVCYVIWYGKNVSFLIAPDLSSVHTVKTPH